MQRPRSVVLPTLVGGNIGTIAVHAGQRIAKGDVVATIVNPQVNSALQTAQAAYDAAQGRAQSAVETNTALPAQNRSSVVQAQANLQQAIVGLQQAQQDYASGQQSGLGYGGSTADDQRVAADTAVAKRGHRPARSAARIRSRPRPVREESDLARRPRPEQARLDEAARAISRRIDSATTSSGNWAVRSRAAGPRRGGRGGGDAGARRRSRRRRLWPPSRTTGDVGAAQRRRRAGGRASCSTRETKWRLTIRAPFAGIVETIARPRQVTGCGPFSPAMRSRREKP